eukprot:61625_1
MVTPHLQINAKDLIQTIKVVGIPHSSDDSDETDESSDSSEAARNASKGGKLLNNNGLYTHRLNLNFGDFKLMYFWLLVCIMIIGNIIFCIYNKKETCFSME